MNDNSFMYGLNTWMHQLELVLIIQVGKIHRNELTFANLTNLVMVLRVTTLCQHDLELQILFVNCHCEFHLHQLDQKS